MLGDVDHRSMAVSQPDPHRAAELLPLVYEELRRLAMQRISQEKVGQTLQATALVHEAYLRLYGVDGKMDWKSRAQFFAAAGEAMRRILVESARRRHSLKRGADWERTPVDVDDLVAPSLSEGVLALDEALTRLATVDPLASELVKLRHFSGLTIREAAEILEVSPRKADALWAYARAWLYRELSCDEEAGTRRAES